MVCANCEHWKEAGHNPFVNQVCCNLNYISDNPKRQTFLA